VKDTISASIGECSYESLLAIETVLNSKNNSYRLVLQTYLDFLRETRSDLSIQKLEEEKSISKSRKTEIQTFRDSLIKKLQFTSGVFSPLLCRMRKSRTSTSSKAKAAAAKARLQYAVKEAELIKEHSILEEKRLVAEAADAREKKDIEIQLNLLKHEQIAVCYRQCWMP
jgi:hypothetical protein